MAVTVEAVYASRSEHCVKQHAMALPIERGRKSDEGDRAVCFGTRVVQKSGIGTVLRLPLGAISKL